MKPDARFPVTTCRGCQAPIIWVWTGKAWTPVDASPKLGWRLDPEQQKANAAGLVGVIGLALEKVHEPHWASCPNADQFSRQQSALTGSAAGK